MAVTNILFLVIIGVIFFTLALAATWAVARHDRWDIGVALWGLYAVLFYAVHQAGPYFGL